MIKINSMGEKKHRSSGKNEKYHKGKYVEKYERSLLFCII